MYKKVRLQPAGFEMFAAVMLVLALVVVMAVLYELGPTLQKEQSRSYLTAANIDSVKLSLATAREATGAYPRTLSDAGLAVTVADGTTLINGQPLYIGSATDTAAIKVGSVDYQVTPDGSHYVLKFTVADANAVRSLRGGDFTVVSSTLGELAVTDRLGDNVLYNQLIGTTTAASSTPCVPKGCAELNAACGNPPDGCGSTVLVNCGSCSSDKVCFNYNCCTPESDSAFCSGHCGSVSDTDNCGAARTVADCGSCNNGDICINGNCVNKNCTFDHWTIDPAQYCTGYSFANTDNCGNAGQTAGTLVCANNTTCNAQTGACDSGSACAEAYWIPDLSTACGQVSQFHLCYDSGGTGTVDDTRTAAGTLTCANGQICNQATGDCVCPAAQVWNMTNNDCENTIATTTTATSTVTDASTSTTCVATSTAAGLCADNNYTCGTLTAVDNCGKNVSADCGVCSSGQLCQNNACCSMTVYYRDYDNDGFGDPQNFVTVCGAAPAGYVLNNLDCNDNDATRTSGESCNDYNFICGQSTVSDIDGNAYPTTAVGNRCVMAGNLRAVHYDDGRVIDGNQTPVDCQCTNTSSKSCCPIDSGPVQLAGGYVTNKTEAEFANDKTVYSWPDLMDNTTTPGVQGACMSGWHVPTDAEWQTLINSIDPAIPADPGTQTGLCQAGFVAAGWPGNDCVQKNFAALASRKSSATDGGDYNANLMNSAVNATGENCAQLYGPAEQSLNSTKLDITYPGFKMVGYGAASNLNPRSVGQDADALFWTSSLSCATTTTASFNLGGTRGRVSFTHNEAYAWARALHAVSGGVEKITQAAVSQLSARCVKN